MFKNKLNIQVDGSQIFILDEDLIWEGETRKIVVKKGFDFDGASIPRSLWSIIGSPMTGGYQRAACLHDALYASEALNRAECDKLFLDAMKSDGVSYVKRNAMYWAVRSAGWMTWNAHDREEVIRYRMIVIAGKKDNK